MITTSHNILLTCNHYIHSNAVDVQLFTTIMENINDGHVLQLFLDMYVVSTTF